MRVARIVELSAQLFGRRAFTAMVMGLSVGIELYDHKGDLGADALDAAAPDVNLAGVARHEATRRALSGVLRAQFRRH